jgi:hypothetical protein
MAVSSPALYFATLLALVQHTEAKIAHHGMGMISKLWSTVYNSHVGWIILFIFILFMAMMAGLVFQQYLPGHVKKIKKTYWAKYQGGKDAVV